MSFEIELFRGDDYVPDGRIPLNPLLQRFFETLLEQPLDGARIVLMFLPEAEATVPEQSDGFSVVNLRPGHGHVRVRVLLDGEVLYQHPHPVSELLGRALRESLLERLPTEQHWGFGIRGPGFDQVPLVRPAPEPTHGVQIEVGARRGRLFEIEEVASPDPPLSTLAALGADLPEQSSAALDPVSVVIAKDVHEALIATYPFSTDVEEGGFLAGRVYRDSTEPDRLLVEVTAVIPAERTGASLLNFTFTGESFLRVGEQLAARHNGEQLIGWYHTHLFRAGRGLGLSTVDVRLHRSTFQQPWQIAALVNIADRSRVLRFYRRAAKGMAQAPYWTVP